MLTSSWESALKQACPALCKLLKKGNVVVSDVEGVKGSWEVEKTAVITLPANTLNSHLLWLGERRESRTLCNYLGRDTKFPRRWILPQWCLSTGCFLHFLSLEDISSQWLFHWQQNSFSLVRCVARLLAHWSFCLASGMKLLVRDFHRRDAALNLMKVSPLGFLLRIENDPIWGWGILSRPRLLVCFAFTIPNRSYLQIIWEGRRQLLYKKNLQSHISHLCGANIPRTIEATLKLCQKLYAVSKTATIRWVTDIKEDRAAIWVPRHSPTRYHHSP